VTALISRRDGSPRRRRRLQRWLGENPLGMLLSAPYVAFVVVVFLVPFGFGIWMSFHDFFFTAPGVQVPQPFVGFDNFAQVLADPQVHQAFLNLLVFLVINVPLTVVLGLLLSSGLNAVVHWKGFFRVAYYIPYVTASVATIAVWIFLFNGNGVVNTLLGELAPDPTWLANPAIIMPLIAVYVTWKNLGFYILLYLAALQNVPQEQYEAAQLDGRGRAGDPVGIGSDDRNVEAEILIRFGHLHHRDGLAATQLAAANDAGIGSLERLHGKNRAVAYEHRLSDVET
jgi:multiple sugar transport system permease protein